MNVVGTGFTKISILLFVKRMIGRSTNIWMYRALWFNIIFVALTTICFEISLFVECRPFHAFWHQVDIAWASSNEYYCVNEGKKLLAAGIISVVQDFIVTTLPLIVIWDLRLPAAKKLGIAAIFAAGYVVCGMGLARVYYTHYIFFDTYDVTWWAAVLGIWTQAELNLGIIVACTPALKAFFNEVLTSKMVTDLYGSSRTLTSRRTGNDEKYTPSNQQRPGLYTQELDDLGEQYYGTDTVSSQQRPEFYTQKPDNMGERYYRTDTRSEEDSVQEEKWEGKVGNYTKYPI